MEGNKLNEIGSFKSKTKPILDELKTDNGLTKDSEIICDTLKIFFFFYQRWQESS